MKFTMAYTVVIMQLEKKLTWNNYKQRCDRVLGVICRYTVPSCR